MIEGDKIRFAELQKKTKPFKTVIAVNEWVGTMSDNCIDTIASKNNFLEVDLLSMDIDGDDYYIAESMKVLHPRVVICEYNPTIPAELDVYQKRGEYLGCSVAALNRIFSSKGYHLVALTDTNCFFVLNNEALKLEAVFETSLDKLRINKYLVNVSTNYGGWPFLLGREKPFPYGVQRDSSTGGIYIDEHAAAIAKSNEIIRLFRKMEPNVRHEYFHKQEAPV